MAALTPAALRLLVVPDRRCLLSVDGVSLTATSEAGPRPGLVTPAQTSEAVFVASGDLDNDLDDVIVSIARAGSAGECEVRWRPDDGSGSGARSWDPPSAISEWEFIAYSTTASKYASPHACRLASGLLLCVVTDAATALTCFRQGAGGKWQQATVATVASSLGSLLVLPSGRVLCHYLSGRTTATVTTQIQVSYSDDDGATWTQGSPSCLSTPAACDLTDITRLRTFLLGSSIGLVWWGSTIDLWQYASGDAGMTFTEIETAATGSYGLAQPDVSVRGGAAYVAVRTTEAAAPVARPSLVVTTSAYTRLSSLLRVVMLPDASPIEASTESAILADDDGTLWYYGRDAAGAATRETYVLVSTDAGATWTRAWTSSAHGHALNVASWALQDSYLRDFCVCPERGRAVLFHGSKQNVATSDDSLMAAYLGGWSTIGMPEDVDYGKFARVGGWDFLWLPLEKPTDLSWSRTIAGAPTQSLGSTGLTITQGGGESQVYYRNPSIASATGAGLLVEFQVKVTSGTQTVDLRISDGAADFAVRAEMTTTTIQLRDVVSGSTIGSATAADFANGCAVILCLSAPSGYAGDVGMVRCKVRDTGNYTVVGPVRDRVWTTVTGSLTLHVAAVATCLVQWGQQAAGAGGSVWRWLGYSGGTYVAGRDGMADPTRGRQVPDRASPVHLEKGLRLAMVSGPAIIGETYTHATSHDYPVESIDVETSMSPACRWRSTDDGTQQDIILTCDAGFRAGDLVALYLGGCNWRTGALYRGAGAATKIMDIDLGITGLKFQRLRGLMHPDQSGGSALPWYAREGALDGGSFENGAGVVRKIRHNRGGMWPSGAGTFPLCELELESYAGGDAASGTGVLWMPQGLFLTTLTASTDTLTLRLDATTTADGYHDTGVALIGRAYGLGRQYGWGHAEEQLSDVARSTLRGGSRRARQLAPQRRAVEIDWQSGVDQTGLYTATAPSWVTAYTGGSAHGDAPGTLPGIAGLLGELKGGALPAVLCLRMPTQASAPTSAAPIRVIDPAVLLYGSVTTDTWRRDQVFGEEGTDYGSVVRGGVLRIEEEL